MSTPPPLPTIYADETHNTGENIRDRNQPVFAAAGVHLEDETATTIVDGVVASLQGGAGEPKYTRLSRRPRGRELLLTAFTALPEGSVKVGVADKNFMTVAKIVDLGVEDEAFNHGHNMLADGSARKLAHGIAILGPIVGDREKFEHILDTFVAVVTHRNPHVPWAYQRAVEEYLSTVNRVDSSIFRMALLPNPDWISRLLHERNAGLHPDTLDPAIPTMATVCKEFSRTLGPLRLVHDESGVIARNKDLLLNLHELPDPAKPEHLMESLDVKEIEFGNSREVAQLKIADWVAGATRDVGMSKLNPPRKSVPDKLVALVDSWLSGPPLWPDQSLFRET